MKKALKVIVVALIIFIIALIVSFVGGVLIKLFPIASLIVSAILVLIIAYSIVDSM